ncbi:unnamed protein product [Toxocara canis]|uniref:Uncharacterized protein n=1 Tax=Toxocara canis TaxID=6265 RepID=A0A183U2U1_TOXCA|nr:unnamed protein product [Toxocara canis]
MKASTSRGKELALTPATAERGALPISDSMVTGQKSVPQEPTKRNFRIRSSHSALLFHQSMLTVVLKVAARIRRGHLRYFLDWSGPATEANRRLPRQPKQEGHAFLSGETTVETVVQGAGVRASIETLQS